ncbi:hypothetical protein ACTFIV_008501 [Dictyostelium citrinum]
MKSSAHIFLLLILISLSKCFIQEYLTFDYNLLCPYSNQQSVFATNTSGLNGSPDPTITLIDSNNQKTKLSCDVISKGGGNIRGPFFCIIPKNLSIAEPIVINYLFPNDADLTNDGVYDSNVTISFNAQKIESIDIDFNSKAIVINGDGLLPRDGVATKENGMSIIAKFNNGSISDNLECTVGIDFKQWICKTKYPQYISNAFEIIYKYQYPTQLKVTNALAIPNPYF